MQWVELFGGNPNNPNIHITRSRDLNKVGVASDLYLTPVDAGTQKTYENNKANYYEVTTKLFWDFFVAVAVVVIDYKVLEVLSTSSSVVK